MLHAYIMLADYMFFVHHIKFTDDIYMYYVYAVYIKA